MSVDERTYVSRVASWIDAILARRTDLPYGEARVEEHPAGGATRMDLKIYARDRQRVALSGEVKMPDRPYGRNVLDRELVEDAFGKASRLGADHYFTWNVNKFALFKTHQAGVPYFERIEEVSDIINIADSDKVWDQTNEEAVQAFWEQLLERLFRLEQGQEQIRVLPLDERFIRRLEYALDEPLTLTRTGAELKSRGDEAFRAALHKWMVEEQGWEIGAVLMPENFERAARLSCYALANRLVFYEVLRRRFTLPPLATVGQHLIGRAMKAVLDARLVEAVRVSRDYETIFEARGLGADLPFVNDEAVPAWLKFVQDIEEFDFTRLVSASGLNSSETPS